MDEANSEATEVEEREERKEAGEGWCRGCRFHTNTTGGHVRGHHDGTLARFEFVQNPIPFVLLLIAMDS
jgi:hypothetical protein